MTGYLALLKLQLISRFADLKPKNLKAAVQGKKSRLVLRGIGILALFIYLGAILFTVETKVLDALMQIGTPDLMVSMVVTMTMLGTLIMSFFYIMSSLFLGRDAGFLASLPVKPRTILSAKLTQVWVSETMISAVLLLPACIQYGVRTGADAGFYLRLIPVWLLVDVIPIVIVSLISTLLIRMSALWKHREMMTTVFGIGFLVIYMFVMGNLGGLSGDSASGGEIIRAFMVNYSARIDAMTQLFPPARWAVRGLMGEWSMLALYTTVCVAAATLSIWLVGMVYRKLSLLQTEVPTGTARKKARKGNFAEGSAFRACCRREIRTILRVPSYATNILPISFMPLLMVVMMGVVMGRSLKEEGETFQMLLGGMDGALVTAILAAVMAYMSGMNPALSTAVSREGKGHDMMMSLPVPAWTIIRGKFAVGFGLAVLGIAAAGIALAVVLPSLGMPVLLACVLCLLFSYGTSCLALIRDIRRPKLDWITEQQAVKQNYGVLFSMLISWGILIALGGATFLLIYAGIGMYPYFGIMAAVLAAWCLLMRRWLRKTAEKYYCQG